MRNPDTLELQECKCGKCPACKYIRVSGWVVRLMEEVKVANSALFVTLTYSPKNLPHDECGFPTLNPYHLELFWKTIRNRYRGKTCPRIKYYACGEYGGETERPHYHLIVFGVTHNDVIAAWQHGNIRIGSVTEASCGYCVGYCNKPKIIPAWDGDERMKEFSRYSKGLGASYLTQAMCSWHKAELLERMCIIGKDGKRSIMPRYYKDRIYTPEEKKAIGIHMAEKFAMEEWEAKMNNWQYDWEKIQSQIAAWDRMYRNHKKRKATFA